MATVVSTLFISLDGVAEIDPAWHFPYFDDAMGAGVGEDYEDVDVLVLGRVTYDSFAGAWPDREAAGGDDASFAQQLGDTRKLVATRGSQELGWRNVERTDDVVAAVRALKDDPSVGKVLVAGSISVVRQLLRRAARRAAAVRPPRRRAHRRAAVRRRRHDPAVRAAARRPVPGGRDQGGLRPRRPARRRDVRRREGAPAGGVRWGPAGLVPRQGAREDEA